MHSWGVAKLFYSNRVPSFFSNRRGALLCNSQSSQLRFVSSYVQITSTFCGRSEHPTVERRQRAPFLLLLSAGISRSRVSSCRAVR
jgi:hypothetical protein